MWDLTLASSSPSPFPQQVKLLMDTPTPIQVDLGRIAQDLQIRRVQVESVVQLLDEGNTVPFITRYRKERTGNLNELAIREIQVRVKRLRDLAERKEAILKAIEAQGKLTEELAAAIRGADNGKRLEDLYLPYKAKKKTKASEARDKGLEPLALRIWNRDETLTDLQAAAAELLDPEKDLDSAEKVLEGVGHILAEAISELAGVREAIRRVVWRTGKLVTSKAENLPEAQGLEYRDYFEYSEPASHIPPHRVLAINRGDKEGPLKVKLEVSRPDLEGAVTGELPLGDHPHADFFRASALDALDRLLLPSMEREVRRDLTEVAERHAVEVFARNLRSLLLQPPIAKQVVLAIDPGFRTGCKVAVLDGHGDLLDQGVIHPHPPQNRRHEAKTFLKDLVGKHKVGVVAIGNGTACRETEELVAEIIAEGTQFSQGGPPAEPAGSTEAPAEPPESTEAPGATAEAPNPEPEPAPEAEPVEASAEAIPSGPEVAEAEGQVQDRPAPLGDANGEEVESTLDDADKPEEAALPPISGGAPDEDEDEATDPAPAAADSPEARPPEVEPAESAELPPSPAQESPDVSATPKLDSADAALPATGPIAEVPQGPDEPALEPAPESSTEPAPGPAPAPADAAMAEVPTPAGSAESTSPESTPTSPPEGEAPASTPPAGPPRSPAAAFAGAPKASPTGGPKPPSQPKPPRPRQPPPPPGPHPADEQLAQLAYVIVNEAGASVYSTSPVGREEFPEHDATLRSAISIGRRLQDPLSELVKIEPQNIGVGLYQHDVNPKQLKESLEGVIESCVNFVGVDLNTASVSLLRHVSGLNQLTARRIVDARKGRNGFSDREQIKEVEGVGPATFTQAAGFLKVPGGDQPFDRTWIHPESYPTAARVLEQFGFGPDVILRRDEMPSLHAKLDEADLPAVARDLQVGEPTLHDIFEALARPERDPREDLPKPIFKKGVLKLEDLSAGMELKGTVLNVVDFGAFVDIGLKDSGLVHISQLANRYIKSPHDVVSVGDVVTAWVMGVDQERKRVSLTMVKPGTERPRGGPGGGGGGGRRAQGEPSAGGDRRGGGGGGGGPRPPRQGMPRREGAPAGVPPPAKAAPRRPDRPPGPGGGARVPRPPQRGGAPGGGRPSQGPGGGPGRFDRAQAPRQAPRPSKPAPPPPPLSKDALTGSVPLRTFGQLKQLWQARTDDDVPDQPATGQAETPPPAPTPAPTAPAPQGEPNPDPQPPPPATETPEA